LQLTILSGEICGADQQGDDDRHQGAESHQPPRKARFVEVVSTQLKMLMTKGPGCSTSC
jgi:hypothetical protein